MQDQKSFFLNLNLSKCKEPFFPVIINFRFVVKQIQKYWILSKNQITYNGLLANLRMNKEKFLRDNPKI